MSVSSAETRVPSGVTRTESSAGTPEGTRVSADETDTAFRAGVGYRFTPHVAVEATYTDYGRSRVDSTFVVMHGVSAAKVLLEDGALSVERRVKGFGADAVFSIPVGANFSILGRAGVLFAEVKAEAATTIEATLANGPFWSDGQGGLTRSGKSTDAAARFGVGLEWTFSRVLAARLEWERLQAVGTSFRDGDSSPTGEARTDFWSAGVAWRF